MKKLPRVTEPDEGLVHFQPVPWTDQVTLCGLSDWIGITMGKPTTKPVTCRMCQGIQRYIHEHAAPVDSDFATKGT